MANAGKLLEWSRLMTTGAKELEEEKFAEAKQSFFQAVALGRQMKQTELLSFSLRMLGLTDNRLGNYSEARKSLSEALEITRSAGNARGQAEALAGLANVAYSQNQPAVAEDLFLEAVGLFTKAGDRLRMAMVLCDLGALYSNSASWDKAREAYEKALETYRCEGEKQGEAEILVMLGELSRRQGILEQAADQLKSACMIFASLKDWRNLASTLQYLGLTYHELGNLEKAAESHRRALALWLELDDKNETALVLFALGKLSQALGQMEEARNYFSHSLELVKDDPEAAGYRCQNLGSVALVQKDWAEAEIRFRNALDYFRMAEKFDRQGEILETLGFLQEVRGDSRGAKQLYSEALQAYQTSSNQKGSAQVYRSLGLLYAEEGLHKKAVENLWVALSLARELELPEALQIEREIQRLSRRIRGVRPS